MVRVLRAPKGMLIPGVLTMGFAEARRARATETKVTLQNIVEKLVEAGGAGRGEQGILMASTAVYGLLKYAGGRNVIHMLTT